MEKNVYLLSLWTWNNFIPVLWPSAKTYYELYGKHTNRYHWVNPVCEAYQTLDDIKKNILETPPDFFGVSLYVWNYERTLALCKWVKETWPDCLIVTGGPHQYFKHHSDWFTKHSFIDASLPSEVYGEIAIADILDNLTDDNKVNWNKVEKMVYPSKNKKVILQSPKATYKLDFKWNYSAFEQQKSHIDHYVETFKKINPDSPLHCKIETTRGCPYECTFCDWGGGVGTKVIIKDLNLVKKDIDILTSYELASVYICDANFGINGDRDVSIVEYLAEKKRNSKNKFPYVQYGGYAKTNRHFDYLKKIFTIEAENQMSYVYKISQQSFDHDILDNIKRTDLRSNEHWELARYLITNYNYDTTVELIFGLPGMTLEKWYHEFDKPFKENALIRSYEWHLLPEAEAYESEYREKFGLVTSPKKKNLDIDNDIHVDNWTMPAELVVGSNTYTREDYRQMMIVYSIYILFVQSGVYNNSVKYMIDSQKLEYGDFLKKFHLEIYPKIKNFSGDSMRYYEQHLDRFVSDTINDAEVTLPWNGDKRYMTIVFNYLMFEFFKNYEKFMEHINQWFMDQGVPKKIVQADSDLVVTEKRMGSNKWQGMYRIHYDNFSTINDLIKDLDGSCFFVYGKILIGKKRLLWF